MREVSTFAEDPSFGDSVLRDLLSSCLFYLPLLFLSFDRTSDKILAVGRALGEIRKENKKKHLVEWVGY